MLFRRKPKVKRSLPRKIINGFIYFGIGIIIALIALFAISQTSTFREWFRDKIITTVNRSINGYFSIGSVDGTIFSSLILNDVVLTQSPDTIFYSEKIDVRLSILEIFFKTIYFRKIEIDNAQINLLKDQEGRLNISKLILPSEEEVDTTSNTFNFKIQVADLSLNNIDFKIQSFENYYSNKVYKNLNSDDFQIKKMSLALSAFIDPAGKKVNVDLKNLSANTNLEGFHLKNLSGNFIIEGDALKATGLTIETSRSNITLNASMKKFPVMGGGEINIEKAPLFLDLNTNDFNFGDLTNFIPSTQLLQGAVRTRVSANGTLRALTLSDLIVSFNETHLRAKGELRNIIHSEKMQIDVTFNGSKINPADADSLLKDIDLPVYKDYGVMQFDTLYFQGNPLNFVSGMYVQTNKGKFKGKVDLNLAQEDMIYDVLLNTVNIDLQPVLGFPTNLTGNLQIKGTGTEPNRMKNQITFRAGASKIQNRNYQVLRANVIAHDALIDYNISFRSDTTSGNLSGKINFTNLRSPSYNLDASIFHLNVGEMLNDKDFESDLNFNISAEGKEFDPDSLDLFAVISIDSSEIKQIPLDGKKMIVDIRKDEGGKRVINLVSNLADVTMQGDFSVLDAASIIKTEADLVSGFVEHSIKSMNFSPDSLVMEDHNDYYLPNKKIDINYAIEFKDFEMLSLLLGKVDMEIDGDINGLLKKSNDSLYVNLLLNVNYFKYWDKENLYYLSNLDLNSSAVNDFTKSFPDGFSSNIKLTANQIFVDKQFKDVYLNTDVRNKQLSFSMHAHI